MRKSQLKERSPAPDSSCPATIWPPVGDHEVPEHCPGFVQCSQGDGKSVYILSGDGREGIIPRENVLIDKTYDDMSQKGHGNCIFFA